jgi:hypothetical protein
MYQSFVLLLVAVILVSVANAYPSNANLRQAQSGDDFLIPPPNSPESAAKAKAFANAYQDYIKSLGTCTY